MPRTKYLKHTISLTLEEMYKGTIRKIAVNKSVACGECKGTGSAFETIEDYETCEECEGFGTHDVFNVNGDVVEYSERICKLCWGYGDIVLREERCHYCGGRKLVGDWCILIINVRPGSRHGQKIVLKGEGDQETDKRPGNIIVILEQKDHDTFKRDGDDLSITMHLDLADSLCGFERLVTTLDNRRILITSPRGKVIQDGETKFLNGEGMPIYKNPVERGRLIITFQLNLPPAIRTRHVQMIERCLPRRECVDVPMDAVECNLVSFFFFNILRVPGDS